MHEAIKLHTKKIKYKYVCPVKMKSKMMEYPCKCSKIKYHL